MSQKVQITGFKLTGHVYAGASDDESPRFLRDGESVVKWMAYNSRVRHNQQRSLRKKYVYQDGVRQLDAAGDPVLVPIGQTVTELTTSEARKTIPWMSAMPSMVLHAAVRDENTSWFSAAKRRKTNAGKGRRGGSMPRFKGKGSPLTFGCYTRNGTQQILAFNRTGKRSGIITLRGFNPTPVVTAENPRAWVLSIRVRIPAKMTINDFTSIQVNLDTMALVFTSPPAVREHTPTGKVAGVDRGVAVLLATSDGQLLNLDEMASAQVKVLEDEYKTNQRAMARSQVTAQKEGRDFRRSNRYRKLKADGRKMARRVSNIKNDWRHKITNDLVNHYDFLALEDLNIKGMTTSAAGTLEKPGKNVAQKRGLNREMQNAAPSTILSMLTYKAIAAAVHLAEVNPRWTSQRCHACGYIDERNRKSQAFRCLDCGHTDHADINAAKNIFDLATGAWDGTRPTRARE